jgi:hypothetical protein
MTKKLSELFELPTDDLPSIEEELVIDIPEEVTTQAYSNLEKIENALPQVRGLEASDTEMDELADLAKSSYTDLMELGMQVDSRFAAEIFSTAGTMLGHAITAKTAKVNKKIKMIELQLKKAALDAKANDKIKEIENIPQGSGTTLVDRNELLKSILGSKNGNNDK